MHRSIRPVLLLAVCLAHALAARPALAQSRLNHERRIRDLELVTQEFVDLQTGQALRWSEIEAMLQAHDRRLVELNGEISALRQSIAGHDELVTRQQSKIELLQREVLSLRAELAAREVRSAKTIETPAASENGRLAEVFRARRPPSRPSGSYYRPVNTERYRQVASQRQATAGLRYVWPQNAAP